MKTYEQALKELQEKYAKAQKVNTADVEAVKKAISALEAVKKAISALEAVSTDSAKVISTAVKRLQSFVNGEKYCTRNRNEGGN